MKRKLRMKGLKVPRMFIWMLGFSHGCIFRTAMVDPESGRISSGYITEKCRLYNDLSAQYVKGMEEDLKETRKEAAILMASEAFLRKGKEAIQIPESTGTITEKRAARRAQSSTEAYDREHRKVIDRLVEISGKIESYETKVREELDSTASALQSIFAVYGRGMLLKPVRENMIPPVAYEKSFEIYNKAHEKENLQMELLLGEVFDYEKR